MRDRFVGKKEIDGERDLQTMRFHGKRGSWDRRRTGIGRIWIYNLTFYLKYCLLLNLGKLVNPRMNMRFI